MKLTCIALFFLFISALPVYAGHRDAAPILPQGNNVVSKIKPLKCPQCGLWQLSSSDPSGLEGDIIFVDGHQIVIPACGVFSYKIENSKAIVQREDRYEYDLTLILTQQNNTQLCFPENDNAWKMEIKVNGHFQEGGTADFLLRKNKTEKPTLELSGWNINREDPCDAGSGSGTAACLMIKGALLYKMLSIKAERAYQKLLQNKSVIKIPSFNVALFSATVSNFCENKEKESGGGSWPVAWSYSCYNRILESKLKEFSTWDACNEEKQGKHKTCKLPSENFDKSMEQETEN